MENPVRYLEEKNGALARTLGETGGLGTVATRADIIEKLFHTFLLEKKGSEILITSKARQLLKLVPEDLKKPGADGPLGAAAVPDGKGRAVSGKSL